MGGYQGGKEFDRVGRVEEVKRCRVAGDITCGLFWKTEIHRGWSEGDGEAWRGKSQAAVVW